MPTPRRSYLKDISGVFSSNLFALLNAFIIDIILSRELGPEGRGIYMSILVVPIIVVSFAMLGIRRSAAYHLGKGLFSENRIISGMMSLMILTSVIAMVVSWTGIVMADPKGMTMPMVLLAVLSIPVRMALVYSGGIYIGKEDFRRSNLQVWLPQLFNLLGVLLFVVLIRGSVTGALFSLFISNLLVASISLSYLFRKYSIRIRFDREVLGSLAGLGVVYAIAVVTMQLNYRVDLLLLQELSTMKEVGYYSLGVAITDKLWQIPASIGLVVMSRSANATDEDELNADVARLLRLSFFFVLILAIILWLIIPFLLPLLFGERFTPSIPIVRWMLPGVLMFVNARVLSGRFAGKGQPLILVAVFLPALLLNILLNLWWIPDYGGIGAAWASNASYTAGSIALLAWFSFKMKISLGEILKFRSSDFSFIKNYLRRRLNGVKPERRTGNQEIDENHG